MCHSDKTRRRPVSLFLPYLSTSFSCARLGRTAGYPVSLVLFAYSRGPFPPGIRSIFVCKLGKGNIITERTLESKSFHRSSSYHLSGGKSRKPPYGGFQGEQRVLAGTRLAASSPLVLLVVLLDDFAAWLISREHMVTKKRHKIFC